MYLAVDIRTKHEFCVGSSMEHCPKAIHFQYIDKVSPQQGHPLKGLIDFDFWCFNATFNNISAISWQPVLVVEETGVLRENYRPWASNW